MVITTIKKQSSFVHINKYGIKTHARYFILIYVKNFTLENHLYCDLNLINNSLISFGIKVTKKIGNAVVRNKIKRRIRHLITLFSDKLNKDKLAFVIIPRFGFEKIKFSLLQQEFSRIVMSQLR